VPEGDAVRRAADRLAALAGDRVEASAPNPRGTLVARAVDGRVLERVDAVGKNLLLRFEGGVVVHSHLGMKGRWRVSPVGATSFGRPWLVLRGTELEAQLWNGSTLRLATGTELRLGPDLLAAGTDAGALARRVVAAGATRLLGDALLDQQLVAGIGNMWLAELLWHERLSPWVAAGDVDLLALAGALGWAQAEMRSAVAGARPVRAVYRRAGRPCLRCGTPISSRGLGDRNRTAYWCPACQVPGPAERAA
jgi:endonuclease VIII